MSKSGALAAITQRVVAPGDNFSNPALAAVSPTSEWVRLSILFLPHKAKGTKGIWINFCAFCAFWALFILLAWGSLVGVARNDQDRVSADPPPLHARLTT